MNKVYDKVSRGWMVVLEGGEVSWTAKKVNGTTFATTEAASQAITKVQPAMHQQFCVIRRAQ